MHFNVALKKIVKTGNRGLLLGTLLSYALGRRRQVVDFQKKIMGMR